MLTEYGERTPRVYANAGEEGANGAMLRLVAGIALLALSIPTWAPNAKAALVLDQQYLPNDSGGFSAGSSLRRAETFTVDVAETPSEISIFHSASPSFTGLDILSTVGGVPTTTVVAAGAVSAQSAGVTVFSVSLPFSIGNVPTKSRM